MTTLLQHAGFILAMAGVVCITLYILGPQAIRSIKGNDPFAPLDEDKDWNVRR